PSLCDASHPKPSGLGLGQVTVEARSSDAVLHHSPSCFYNRHVVVAIILCDEAHGRPVFLMVVWVVGDELLCVRLVQSVNLNGALQGVAQQEHLHLHRKTQRRRHNCTVTEGTPADFSNISCSST
uniref:Uncharacterized protein n=1 Tax=Amphiprion ocellaris TaxID=80972 RepID=A0AAQ5ZXA6_AMPOC